MVFLDFLDQYQSSTRIFTQKFMACSNDAKSQPTTLLDTFTDPLDNFSIFAFFVLGLVVLVIVGYCSFKQTKASEVGVILLHE